MKKTLLSVIIAGAATSVSAIEVYNENGTSVNLNGEVKGLYERHTYNDTSAKIFKKLYGDGFDRAEVNPSAELKITGETDIGHGIKAFGSFKIKGGEETKTTDPTVMVDLDKLEQQLNNLDFNLESALKIKQGSYEREDEIKIEDIVLGFKSDTGTLTIGKTDSSLDILGSANMTNELKHSYDYFEDANQARGIRAQANFNDISLSLDYQDLKELKYGQDYLAGSITQKVDLFKYGATYGRTINSDNTGSVLGAMAGIEIDGLEVVATFAKYNDMKLFKVDNVGSDINVNFEYEGKHYKKTIHSYFDANVITLGASYTMQDLKLYTGYERIKSDNLGYYSVNAHNIDLKFGGIEMKYNTYHLGAEYTLHKNFKVFAEGAIIKGDWGCDDTGKKEYIVGGQYIF